MACTIIAEAGVNHDCSPEKAMDLVAAAAKYGADAIKFQTYTASKISTKAARPYWKSGHSQWETFDALDKLPDDVLGECFRYAKELGIFGFSTPFDLDAVGRLVKLGAGAMKIASADITYHGLIREAARTKLPLYLSTGASTDDEVDKAIDVCAPYRQPVLLHCTLVYPCPPEAINLDGMLALRSIFPGYSVGLSDHSLGTAIPIAAVALGAQVIEKHFTLDKSAPGSPDHHLSVDRLELAHMARGIRDVESARGPRRKMPHQSECDARRLARRSVTSAVDIPAGTVLTEEMVTCKRPGTGITAEDEALVIGFTAKEAIPADTTLTWEMLA